VMANTMFWLAFLGLLGCANASLEPYQVELLSPHNCQTCIELFTPMFELPYGPDRDDMIYKTCKSCSGLPDNILNLSVKKNCYSQVTEGITPQDFCAGMGVCQSACEFCGSRVAGAFVSAKEGNNFCKAYFTYAAEDEVACRGMMIDIINNGATDTQVHDYCNRTDMPTRACNPYGEYNPHPCLLEPPMKDCKNGEVAKSHENVKGIFLKADKSGKQTRYFENPCGATETCICKPGWTKDANGICTVQTSTEEELASLNDLMSQRREGRPTVGEDVEEAFESMLERAKRLRSEQMQATGGPDGWDCTGADWKYFTDSPVDGVTYNEVGVTSDHEYYAFAVKQNYTHVTIAMNINLYPEGQIMENTVVSMGDWIINPVQNDGKYKPLPKANEDGTLYGIRMDATNDNSNMELGIYKDAHFISVTGSNNGFRMVSEYINFVNNLASTTNPIGAYVAFGAGIDAEAGEGVGYLGEIPLNEMDDGELLYEINTDYYVVDEWDEGENSQAVNDLGLLWQTYNGIGANTRMFTFPRPAFPDQGWDYRFQVASECYNDIMAAVVHLCAVPSHSPSPSSTRQPSPTISVTPSETRGSTGTPTPSRSGSATPSSSGAPSFPSGDFYSLDQCGCIDYGNEPQPINTLVLGDFEGTSDTEGTLFVCGDASLRDYSVSSKLHLNHHRDDLVVMGNLDYPIGRVHGGNIVYGGIATLGRPVAEGIAAYNMTIRKDPHRYDCDNAELYFKTLSFELGNLRATGKTTLHKDGTLEFTRQSSSNPEIFEFECNNFNTVNKMIFSSVSASGTVVVNMQGSHCDLTTFVIDPVTSSKLLFNFPQASTINLGGVALEGNFVAPFADVTGIGGDIMGQSVMGSFKGSTKQHYVHCNACVTGESSDLELDVF